MRDTGGGSGGETGGDERTVAASGRVAEPTSESTKQLLQLRANLPHAIALLRLASYVQAKKAGLKKISSWPIVMGWTSPALDCFQKVVLGDVRRT